MLNDLLYGLKQSGVAVENVVYLGAGTCPDFHRIKELHPARIVLVEANKQHVAELIGTYGREENLVVLENLVVANEEESEAELLVTNLAAYSSILEPSSLSIYYPNIRVVRRDKVAAITLQQICYRFAIDAKGGNSSVESAAPQNVLIVDLAGYEANFFASLSPATMASFDVIFCRVATEAVYAGAEPLPAIEQILHRQHFVTEVVRELAYPFVLLHATPDKFTHLHSRLNDAESKNELLEKRLESVQADLRAEHSAREAAELAYKQLENESTEVRTELDKIRKKSEELSCQLESVQAELLTAQSAKEAMAHEYEQLVTESVAVRWELGDVRKKSGELECQLVGVQAQLQAEQDGKQAKADELEQLQVGNAVLRTEKEELSKSNQLFGKTLLKVQSDLDDIRRQYRDLYQAKAHQNGVMMQVAQRLERASKQYMKLIEKYPELRELGEAVLLPVVAATEGETE